MLECVPSATFSYTSAYRYASVSLSTLASSSVLPDDEVVVSDSETKAPLFVCRAWPNRKMPQGVVRVNCEDFIFNALRASPVGSVHLRRQSHGDRIAPARVVSVLRRAGAGFAARGGPSLKSLRQLLQGVVLRRLGLSLELPGGMPPLDIVAFQESAEYVYIDGDTLFREGGGEGSRARSDASTALAAKPPAGPLVGGLGPQLAELAELCNTALHGSPELLALGLRPPRGALLCGPPGTGKTLLAAALAAQVDAPLHVINGSELLSNTVGDTERRLRALWAQSSGGILFLDEVDAIAPSRDGDADGSGEADARVVAALLALMDGVAGGSEADTSAGGRVFVLGATNRQEAIDSALRRPGRFDKEINLPIPTATDRIEILRVCLGQYPNDVPVEVVEQVAAERMHGFVGADIAATCREAAYATLLRASTSTRSSDSVEALSADMRSMSMKGDASKGAELILHADELVSAISRVQPSALRAISVEVASTPWDAIAGQETTKKRLREAIEWPTVHAALFTELGIRPPRGILLYGPPGCSKTMMARAMATSGKANFIAVKGPELFSKYVGDSEKAVAEVFSRARAAAPCVVFFDEFDALAASRDDEDGASVSVRVVAQLLVELDGVSSSQSSAAAVIVVAATNRPDLIDAALLRPGRLDALLYVGLPDAAAREAIIASHLLRMPHDAEVKPAPLAEGMDGYSGAEVVGIMRDASIRAVHEAFEASSGNTEAQPLLTLRHLRASLDGTPRQVTADMLDFYKRWGESGMMIKK